MCSDHLSPDMACRLRSAFSLHSSDSFQAVWGLYVPRIPGRRSLIFLLLAGHNFVTGSAVFLYYNRARWNLSEMRSPWPSTLPEMRRLIGFTATSARQLLWGKAMKLRLWCTPQSWRNCVVTVDVNSGPPSDASSSGIPNVANDSRSMLMRPLTPSPAFIMIGQFE